MLESHLAQAIIEGTSDAVFVKDTEGRYLLVNEAAAKFIGRPKEQILGRTDRDWFRGASVDELLRRDQDVMRGGRWETREETLTSDGTRTYSASKGPLRDEHGRVVGIIGISRDVTQQKKDALQLSLYAEQMKKSNEALERFAHVISHDLKEPLRVLVMNVSRARRTLGDSCSRTAEYLTAAEASGLRMNDLIGQVLADATLSQNPEPFTLCDTRKVVGQMLLDLNAALDEVRGTVHVEELPPVRGNASQLLQLFQNLFVNALRYRSEERLWVRIGAQRDGNHWFFFVEDNGVGVPAEARERIFLPYERFAHPDRPSGTGIGLATCKRIVEIHGGRIWVEDRTDGGSVFRFTLPVAM